MGVRHTLGQLDGSGALFIAGRINVAAGVPTLQLSGPVGQQNDVTITDNGVGDYDLTIANFKGPLGFAIGVVSVNSNAAGMAMVESYSYSGDTLSMGIGVIATSTSTRVDSGVGFIIWAF